MSLSTWSVKWSFIYNFLHVSHLSLFPSAQKKSVCHHPAHCHLHKVQPSYSCASPWLIVLILHLCCSEERDKVLSVDLACMLPRSESDQASVGCSWITRLIHGGWACLMYSPRQVRTQGKIYTVSGRWIWCLCSPLLAITAHYSNPLFFSFSLYSCINQSQLFKSLFLMPMWQRSISFWL